MKTLTILTIIFATALISSSAFSTTFYYNDLSGLSATADFSVSSGKLVIVLTNTSTGVPSGFSNSDQVLSTLSFNLPDLVNIGSGEVFISEGSYSVNFDNVGGIQLTGGADVSPEWGYGNEDGTGFTYDPDHKHLITAMISHAIKFKPGNLDGSVNIDGPQGGLTNGIIPLGGIGAIHNSVTSYLTLTGIDLTIPGNIENLLFSITSKGVVFEFGSDAAFGHSEQNRPVPEPATIAMFLLGIALIAGWKLQTRFF